MKFSVTCYPHDPVPKVLELADAAEALGFDAFYVTDSTYRQDPSILLGAIAQRTKRIRIGANCVRLRITDPLVAARELGTLDQMSGGRVDGVLGLGWGAFVRAQSADGAPKRSDTAFLREAFKVVRHALANTSIDFEGEYLRYHYTGIPMVAQSVQKHLPLAYGSGGGPKAIELAGEIADGLHLGGVRRAAIEFGLEHVRRGAERAGRDWRSLELTTGVPIACSEDGDWARDVARAHATFYLSEGFPRSLMPEFLERGFKTQLLDSIKAVWAAGDRAGAVALVPHELADFLTVAGTPDECVSKLRANMAPGGINHLSFTPVDAGYARTILGSGAVERTSAPRQLELIQKHVLPQLGAPSAG